MMDEYWLTQYRRKYESYMREAIREGRKFSLRHDMTDPIRNLWAQCVTKHTKTPMNWQDVADEFAEVIVNQCIFEVVQRSAKYYSDNFIVQDFTVDVVNDIKDRFGIE